MLVELALTSILLKHPQELQQHSGADHQILQHSDFWIFINTLEGHQMSL
jgi:hypothetical protein